MGRNVDDLLKMATTGPAVKVHFWRAAFEPYGHVGYITGNRGATIEALLDKGFAAFNRDSGRSVDFQGPSASRGDLFIVERSTGAERPELRAYEVGSVGFHLTTLGELSHGDLLGIRQPCRDSGLNRMADR